MLYAVLVALFGDPRTVLALRVLGALAALCPCSPADAGCEERHRSAAAVIALVSEGDDDAARLLAAGAHETGFRVRRQAEGGPARSWFQVEPRGATRAERRADAERLERDPLYAAGAALAIARRGWGAYACGDPRRCPGAAAELRQYERRARSALAAR